MHKNIKVTKQGGPAESAPKPFLHWVLVLYFVLEYVRPPGIVDLRLQLIIVVVMLFAFLTDKNRPWSNLFTAQVLFLLIIAKAGLYAVNTFNVFHGTKSVFASVIVGFATAWLSSSMESFKKIMTAWFLVLVYSSIYCIANGGRGPGSFMGDENDMAMAACVGLPFAMFGFEHLTGKKRWACLVCGILFVAAIVSTMSRGGFLGLLSVGLYYFISSSHKMRKLLILSVAAVSFVIFVPNQYLAEMGTIKKDVVQKDDEFSTAQQRFFLWTTALEMGKAHPFLGVGIDNFPWNVGSYQPTTGDWPEQFFLQMRTGQAVHSTYFQVIAEQGIPGILLYLYLIWAHFRNGTEFRRSMKARSDIPDHLAREMEVYSLGLMGAMIGYLASAAFISTFTYPYFWFLLNITVGFILAARNKLSAFYQHSESGPAESTAKPKYSKAPVST